MNQYIEITLLPNTGMNLFSLWSKVFQQIHLGLVEMQNDQKQVPIGISFPEYVTGDKCSVLGGKLRLFAQDEATLAKLDTAKWLSRLSDYVHCTSIRPVPDKLTGYAIYQRQQPKTNKERLARRYAKRHKVDFETALNGTVVLRDQSTQFRYCDMQQPTIKPPFIRLQSLSSKQTFCLWIKKALVSEPTAGHYSSYGLSATAAVPEF
jgi:CRISPR-associated endonuclease Csy4